MVNIGIGTAALTALLGYSVVFLGIVFLMVVIAIVGKCMNNAKPAVANANANANIKYPAGMDPKKVAAISAAIAEYEGEVK